MKILTYRNIRSDISNGNSEIMSKFDVALENHVPVKQLSENMFIFEIVVCKYYCFCIVLLLICLLRCAWSDSRQLNGR